MFDDDATDDGAGGESTTADADVTQDAEVTQDADATTDSEKGTEERSSPDGSRRERFAAWRRERPFWGAVILTVAGLLIGVIPLDLAMRFALVPNQFAFVGLIFAILVTMCGLSALFYPGMSTPFGALGVLFAVASLFGALGGFLVGMFLGALGGSMCVAWRPPDELASIRDERPPLRTRLRAVAGGLLS